MRGLGRAMLATVCAAIVLSIAVGVIRAPQATSAPAAVKRHIYMAAVEPRGGTSVTSEPYPTTALPAGPGYVLRPPDATGRWEVSAYYWQPSFVVVSEGDDVTLEILGINGAEHPATVEGVNVPGFTVRRGQVTTVNFRAGRPGSYRIVCTTHLPTMVGQLVVLPGR